MKTIHPLVDVDASTDTVWAALTREDQMAGWWSTKVDAPNAEVGTLVRWTFADDFNPVMEIVESTEPSSLVLRCADGQDAKRVRVRFWQDYAVELADDYYGTYNFNWGYYLESLRLLCSTGTGKPFPVN